MTFLRHFWLQIAYSRLSGCPIESVNDIDPANYPLLVVVVVGANVQHEKGRARYTLPQQHSSIQKDEQIHSKLTLRQEHSFFFLNTSEA